MDKKNTTFILASNSPRRRQLLAVLGLEFQVIPAEVDETPRSGESPQEYVVRLAVEKAEFVQASLGLAAIVIAADTTVVAGDQILGKPVDGVEAYKMLQQLRGRKHQVFSGVALTGNGNLITELCGTDVPMRPYSDEEIKRYIASGDPLDKAGAYAIQHPGFHPVTAIHGCYANVMGLPLCHLTIALRKIDVHLGVDVPGACREITRYKCPISGTILGSN
jgi:septum formation protein